MKNLIKTLSLLLLVTFTTNSFAQNFGLRGGINLANISFEEEDLGADSKIGLVIGGIAEIGLSELISLQPELNFVQKGYQLDIDFFGSKIESKANINYLDVPVNVKVGFDAGGAKIYFLAGPGFGYALNGSIEFCESGNCESEDLEFDNDDGFNRFEISGNLGAGVQFGQIFVDLRYVLGISNLNEDDVDGNASNRGFQISAGYMFGGGE